MVTTTFANLPDGFQFLSLFDQAFAQSSYGINGTIVSKTAAYTLSPSDIGASIGLDGGTFYSLTLNAANTYPANFTCSVVNIDTTRES